MRQSLLAQLSATADRASRFAAFDPWLNTARAAGIVRWGPSVSAMVHASALRWPRRPAVIDECGQVSYRDLDRTADRLARSLRTHGTGRIGLLCRNHRGFIQGYLALERAGRDVVLLSTGLPPAQLLQIIEREELDGVIADAEFTGSLASSSIKIWPGDPTTMTKWGRSGLHRWPPRRTDVVLLTSGTTGPPKGARQGARVPSLGDAALLDAIPLRVGETVMVVSPLFHAWGFAQASLAMATGSTLVLQPRFVPDAALAAMKAHGVTTLAAVPLMLSQMLDIASPDLALPELRTVLSSGNVLSASLASRWTERFGPNLYNIYGSTETAIASVATPTDLAEAPGTVGRPPPGVQVVIVDDDDKAVPTGALGRVFTANSMQFAGYTDGSSRKRLGALMATGDMGYLDDNGRLFVDGRENDLIVTGGENVFPSQIEELLEQHPQVQQAAVVAMPDDQYGQIVATYLVTHSNFSRTAFDSWCRKEMASFQRPRHVTVVDQLPMTTTGKIKRGALAQRLADASPQSKRRPPTRKPAKRKPSQRKPPAPKSRSKRTL